MVTFDRLEITPDGKHLIIDARVNSMPYFEDLGIEGVYINSDLDFLESGLKEDAIIYSKSFAEIYPAKLALYKSEKSLVGYVPGAYNNTQEEPVFYINDKAHSYYKNISIDQLTGEKLQIINVTKSPEGENLVGFLDKRYPSSEFYVKTGELDTTYVTATDSFILPIHTKPAYPKHIRLMINCSEIVSEDIKDFSSNMFFVFIKTHGTPSSNIPCGMDSEYTMGVTFDTTLIYQKALSYIRELGGDCKIPKNFIDFILQFEALKACIETDHFTEAIKYFKRMFKKITNSTSYGCGCNK